MILKPKDKKEKFVGSASSSGLAFPKPERKQRIKVKNETELEDSVQDRAERYLDSLGIQFIHLPSSLFTSIIFGSNQRAKNEVSEYLKGIPDLLIIIPHNSGMYNFTHALELKREKGGKISQGQRSWALKANVSFAFGWEAVKAEIDNFIKWTKLQ
jgi:hypothetical protein